MNPYIVFPDLNGEGLHVGIVRARFNEEIGNAQQEACVAELVALGVDVRDITVLSVPGALEVGLTLAQMAETSEFDALIALGAVIRGETYHFEIVSNESAAAITRVSLDTGMPVANGILTAETDEQAQERAAEKGRDCARAAVEMANLIALLEPDFDEDDEDENDDEAEDDDFDEEENLDDDN
ncbi:6,7-dimethyl-8-ribityllumazine synthase [Paenalcaligenes niemegkensis]|uniref:6,7-dimethyl-8-ribityllumazine synthase n=1 Tax=Paenalcaligenes niemegkensis TaxID=2895469 RepID=UPI001EE7F0CF|nr:6,7-dimethyl-8-ribityllumazine synthase [Paenalcaligenes niemegkensis]MCQ9615341.1 6,7-dimethyl-8-ribityllumazine synthase [Paenalcaligenes niemegkensis]